MDKRAKLLISHAYTYEYHNRAKFIIRTLNHAQLALIATLIAFHSVHSFIINIYSLLEFLKHFEGIS